MIGIHSSLLEWITFATAAVWCAASAYAIREAIIDQAFLLASGQDGPRKLIADGNVRQEAARLLKATAMLLASLSALFLEPPPPEYTMLPQSLVFLVAWIVVGTIGTLSTLLDKSNRRKLALYSTETHPTDPATGQPVDRKGPEALPNGAGKAIDGPGGRRAEDRSDAP